MRRAFALLIVGLVALGASVSVAHSRTWTSTDGRTIEADLDHIEGNVIVLKMAAGGKLVRIQADKFTPFDQEFARKQQAIKDRLNPAAKAPPGGPAKTPAKPQPGGLLPPKDSGKAPSNVGTKEPVPDAENQAKGEAFVKETFGADIAAATKGAKKIELASKLVEEAATNIKVPGLHYALLKNACRIAADGGDADLATKIAQQMADHFDVNVLKIQAALVAQAAPAGDATQSQTNAEIALSIADQCAAENLFEQGRKAADAARVAAVKGGKQDVAAAATKRARSLSHMESEHLKIADALSTLEKDPENEAANLAVGKFKCFVVSRWSDGLPLLAKGSDKKLAKLATDELSASTGDAETVARVADSWWDASARVEAAEKANVRAHAGTLYQQALPGLTGPAKAKAEKRGAMASPDASGSNFATASGGAPTTNLRYDRPEPAGLISIGTSVSSQLHFTADGRHLIFPAKDGLFVADVMTRRTRQLTRAPGNRVVKDGTICPDKINYALAMADGRVVICDSRGKVLKEFDAHDTSGPYIGARGLGYSPDGTMLVTLGEGGMVRFWDGTTYEKKGEIRSDPNSVFLDFQKTGNLMSVCCMHHGEVRLIEWHRPRLIKGFPPTTMGGAFSPDDGRVALNGDLMRVYDVKTQKVVVELKNTMGFPVAQNAWFPDGKHVACAGMGGAWIWDTEANKIAWQRDLKPMNPDALALSPDGLYLAVLLGDRSGHYIQLWRMNSR